MKENLFKYKIKIKYFQIVSAHVYGVLMIGDDFLLGVAMLNLKFAVGTEARDEGEGVIHCGYYCVSGLTIKNATERVRIIPEGERSAIVYLGSVDIIQGENLAALDKAFRNFIDACRKKLLFPVLCTLAPIPTHQLGNRKSTLVDFNNCLRFVVILRVAGNLK